ncbi:MAG TPA: molybdopterin-dependent oxidoreductase [Candidatus Cloacimonadota bacterium]|nr:molybdopterin-dependent oxidoreductase [Candidatus Cloacimonadota bacterium]
MSKRPEHISGRLHLTGSSAFIGDEAPAPGMLHAAFAYSPVAHARLIRLDISRSLSYQGVFRVVTAADIPQENQIGHVIKDEPLFPDKIIMYHSQPLAMVLAEDKSIAEHAAGLIIPEYEELDPILDVEAADQAGEYYVPERRIESGDPKSALKSAPHRLSGITRSEGQEHFYMESQRARAIPGEGGRITIFAATQSTMECQEVIAHLLGIPAHNVIIEVPRLGGAFGGKERAGTIWATMAALGAYLTHRPVEILLNRDEDLRATGKRHPFLSRWTVGYDDDGRILAYDVLQLANGGAYADLSVAILERAMFHAENTYHIEHIRIRGRACRTNLPPNTAFRGFGAPQGIFVIESILEKLATLLNKDILELRRMNSYRNGDVAPYGQTVQTSPLDSIFSRLTKISAYQELKSQVSDFNQNSAYIKQGIGIVPVKFGISFTTALLNQGSALIWVYIDGSVSVTTGGIEMGQELSTKVAVVVAKTLGIPITTIHVESANSQRVGNASPTAASTGSDINGNAARIAAEKIRNNLIPAAVELFGSKHGCTVPEDCVVFEEGKVLCAQCSESLEFTELVRYAYNSRIPLAAYGYYRTPDIYFDRDLGKGKPFHYYVFGAALTHVQLDLLTGEHTVLATHIVHENGNSLHPDIDRGQVIGAFIQSLGWCTMEELPVDAKGRYLAVNPSTYKIPTIRDLPEKLTLEFLTTGSEHASVYGSKATGEPPFIYGLSVFFALQNAVKSVDPTAELSFPATPEALLLALKQAKARI